MTGDRSFIEWKVELQRDGYNCGIWAIWIHENGMQYWMQEQVPTSFETWFKKEVQHLPSGAGFRVQCREHLHTAMQVGIDGKSGCRRSQDMSGIRMANSRDRAHQSAHRAQMQQEEKARCRPEAVQYSHNQPVAQQMPRTRRKAQANTATSTALPSGGPCKGRRPGRPNLHADKKRMNGQRHNTDTDCFQKLTNQHKLSSKGACINSAINSIDARAKTEKDQPHQSHQSTLLSWLGPKRSHADRPCQQRLLFAIGTLLAMRQDLDARLDHIVTFNRSHSLYFDLQDRTSPHY